MNPSWFQFPWSLPPGSQWGAPWSLGAPWSASTGPREPGPDGAGSLPMDFAGVFARSLLAALGGTLDESWLIEGVRQQIRFWSALEQQLSAARVSTGPTPVFRPGHADAPILVISGQHGDRDLTGTFRVQNPTAAALVPSFSIEPTQAEDGALVTDDVVEIAPEAAAPLAPGEIREIAVRAHPDRLPGPGRYRARVTVRSPLPRHLVIELQIRP